jgi:hypothetical protein
VPATTIKINNEQRDGLYELVRNHLGSAGDLFDALEREKNFGKAERLGLELAEDIRLMQDLGWDEDEGGEGVELTMAPHDLMEALQRLHGEAGLVLAGAAGSTEDAETNNRFQRGYEACEKVLANLDPRVGEGA